MQIKRDDFITALKKVINATSKSGPVRGSECFHFDGKHLIGYQGWLLVVLDFPTEFKGSVDALKLMKWMNTTKQTHINVEQEANALVFSEKGKKAKFPLVDEAVLSIAHSIIDSETFFNEIPVPFFTTMKSLILPSTSKLSGIYCNGEAICSTDGVAINHATFDMNLHPFWLANKGVTELLKFGSIGLTECGTAEGFVRFRGDGVQLAMRKLFENTYPYQRLSSFVTNDYEVHAMFEANNDLLNAVQSCLIFSEQKKEDDALVNYLKLRVKDGITLQVVGYDGETTEEVDTETDGSYTCRVDANRLIRMLKLGFGKYEVVEMGGSVFIRHEHDNMVNIVGVRE